MKLWLGGYHLVMKIDFRVPDDKTLMQIGYRYISHKFLGFINCYRNIGLHRVDILDLRLEYH